MKLRDRNHVPRFTFYPTFGPYARANVPRRRHRSEGGTAVIVILFFLAILLIYIAGNLRTLHNLGRELKLLDQKQVRRLEHFSGANSSLSVTNVVVEPERPSGRVISK